METFHPRSVLIDMEPKVIAQSMASANQSKHWSYSAKQHFSQKSGSGNNWAHGYCVHGMKCDDQIENLIRAQVEKCDRYEYRYRHKPCFIYIRYNTLPCY